MLADQILDAKGRDVATVAPDATVRDAVAVLAEHNVGALVVSSDGSSVDGIISERDIVRRLAADGAAVMDRLVADLMKTEVATCDGPLRLRADHGRDDRRPLPAPARRRGRQLQGIISIGDVVKARIGELATEREQLVGYIRDGR